MISQVHDELLFEVPIKHADAMKIKVKELMEHAVNFKVPLQAEVGTGKNWGEAH